jgi:hypothetical protein
LRADLRAEVIVQALQRAVGRPVPKVAVYRLPRRQVTGQIAPGTTGACLIKDGVQDFTAVVLSGCPAAITSPALWQQGLD